MARHADSRAWRDGYLHGFFGVSASIGVAVTGVQVGRFEIVLRKNAAEALTGPRLVVQQS